MGWHPSALHWPAATALQHCYGGFGQHFAVLLQNISMIDHEDTTLLLFALTIGNWEIKFVTPQCLRKKNDLQTYFHQFSSKCMPSWKNPILWDFSRGTPTFLGFFQDWVIFHSFVSESFFVTFSTASDLKSILAGWGAGLGCFIFNNLISRCSERTWGEETGNLERLHTNIWEVERKNIGGAGSTAIRLLKKVMDSAQRKELKCLE